MTTREKQAAKLCQLLQGGMSTLEICAARIGKSQRHTARLLRTDPRFRIRRLPSLCGYRVWLAEGGDRP